MDAAYTCPVCGYPELANQPWNEHGRNASFEICPCCGIQFGNDDLPMEDTITIAELHDKWRDKWIEGGMKYVYPRTKPDGWNPIVQLKKAGLM